MKADGTPGEDEITSAAAPRRVPGRECGAVSPDRRRRHARASTVLLALGAGLAVLSGCARFQPKPLSPADSAAQLESRSLTNADLKVFLERNLQRDLAPWPPKAWDFDLLTLTAFYYQPSLEVARADWQLAQGGEKTAAGRLNPTVTAGSGFDNGIANNFSPWLPGISFDLPIETAG